MTVRVVGVVREPRISRASRGFGGGERHAAIVDRARRGTKFGGWAIGTLPVALRAW